MPKSMFHSVGQTFLQGRGDSSHEALQDVDDWDLMEVNPDCDLADGSVSSPPPPPLPVPPASIHQACFKVMLNKLHRMNALHRTQPVKPEPPHPPATSFPTDETSVSLAPPPQVTLDPPWMAALSPVP